MSWCAQLWDSIQLVLGGCAVQQCASVGHRTGRSSNSWISSELLQAAVRYGTSLLGYLWQGTDISVLLQQCWCKRCHSKGSLLFLVSLHLLIEGLKGHKPVRSFSSPLPVTLSANRAPDLLHYCYSNVLIKEEAPDECPFRGDYLSIQRKTVLFFIGHSNGKSFHACRLFLKHTGA